MTETIVNSYTTGNQWAGKTAALAGGGWVTCWQSIDQPGDEQGGIYFQQYAADGTKIGGEKHPSSLYPVGNQSMQSITALADGGFAIVWTTPDAANTGNEIYLQRFDSNGNPAGNYTHVNKTVADDQAYSDVTALADGSFLVTWSYCV